MKICTNSLCLGLKDREIPHQVVYSLLLLLNDAHEPLQIRFALVQLLAHQRVVLELVIHKARVFLLVLLELLHQVVVALAGLLAGYQRANAVVRVQKLDSERFVFFPELRVLLQ